MLKIINLHASVEGKEILKGISITFNKGEIHAIMGRNGCGKSTLAKVIAGHPAYEITDGDIQVLSEGKYISIIEMEPEERAALGIFIGFQSPISIPGLDTESFLRTVTNTYRERLGQERFDAADFRDYILRKMSDLGLGEEFLKRGVNSNFSGGERKKNEMLQLSLLNPTLAILDEIDSGLDVDALAAICKDILLLKNQDNTFVMITHYDRILKNIKPDFIHIFHDGKLVLSSSDSKIAAEIEEHGFESFLGGK